MNKKKTIITISIILGSLLLTYFGGGFLGMLTADNIVNKRYSDISNIDDDFYRIQKVRTDYDLLDNREVVTFESKNEALTGYYYQNTSPKGVIVMAHGVNNMADGNMAEMQDYFVRNNYDLFTFDMVGCGRSTGKGLTSLYESKYCVYNAIKKVKEMESTKDLPLFLIGHSWGGYGVSSVTSMYNDVDAVVTFSSYNTPNEMMMGFVETNTSPILRFTKPILDISCYFLYGSEMFYSSENSIKENKGIPYMVIQGELDDTVPLKGVSLYDNVIRDNYSNVTPILLEDIYHGAPWKTLEAQEYTKKVNKELKELYKKYNNKLPENIREEYLSNIDLEKTSEINLDLMDRIDEFLIDSIN